MIAPEELVRAYYDALDEHAYDDLSGLIAPSFVQDRPDRTFEGREAFVSFMRDDRPQSDTTHEIERVFPGAETVAAGGSGEEAVAVEGRLLDADGELLFGFVDVHTVEDGRIVHLQTYTH